jgi:hypothetical protein
MDSGRVSPKNWRLKTSTVHAGASSTSDMHCIIKKCLGKSAIIMLIDVRKRNDIAKTVDITTTLFVGAFLRLPNISLRNLYSRIVKPSSIKNVIRNEAVKNRPDL